MIYGLFFLAGWALHRRPELRHAWSRRARLRLALATLTAATAFVVFRDGVGSPWLSSGWIDLLRATFSWLMTLGLIGAFATRFEQAPWARFWSERAYLFYLLHLPIVLLLQRLLEAQPWPAIMKYLLIAGGTMIALEVAYRAWSGSRPKTSTRFLPERLAR